mmetsp:Transcript_59532/g.166259  ORF Transcript_59532/g.166259 Transcript_59532/m.166259 type:complete len:250 (+) Transcript_59532:117-866(+)
MARLADVTHEEGAASTDLDADDLEHSLEELRLETDIRALEIEEALVRLEKQIKLQEQHVHDWQKAFGKAKDLPPSFRAELEQAQEGIQRLRKQHSTLEASRPPRPSPLPAHPRANSKNAVSEDDPAPAQQESSTSNAGRPPSGGSRAASGRAAAATAHDAAHFPPAMPGPVEMARRSAARASGQRQGSARASSRSKSQSGAPPAEKPVPNKSASGGARRAGSRDPGGGPSAGRSGSRGPGEGPYPVLRG